MGAQFIDGKAYAENLRKHMSEHVSRLTAQGMRKPGLAVVLVGDNPASHVYVKNKAKQTVEVGMHSVEHRLNENTSEHDLLALVETLNRDDTIDGILVQLPLPDHIDAQKVIEAIHPDKDVDGFHPMNAGRLATGTDGFVPCTPLGSLMLILSVEKSLSGYEAVIVGRSNIVGKPMAQLLLNQNCTVTIAHSRTRDLPDVCRRADILIAAVGRPEMIRGDWIKQGAIVIDVGINRVPALELGTSKTRLTGDVAFEEARLRARAITPVPGGVGPMTIACLLRNTLISFCRRHAIPEPVF
jgi:methylenetetrahydrofolate dehydrogenase (NADP+)/methenyltetrahydrofolate cyclohydrolase